MIDKLEEMQTAQYHSGLGNEIIEKINEIINEVNSLREDIDKIMGFKQ